LGAVWLVSSALVAIHPAQESEGREPWDIWRRFATCAAISIVCWLAFSFVYGWAAEQTAHALRGSSGDASWWATISLLLSCAYGLFVILCASAPVPGQSPRQMARRESTLRVVLSAALATAVIALCASPSLSALRVSEVPATLGLALEGAHDWEAAANYYQTAARMQPRDSEYQVDVGRMYLEKARTEFSQGPRDTDIRLARMSFEEARSRTPLNGRYVYLLASLEREASLLVEPSERQQHAAEADRFYAEAIALMPLSPSTWHDWGTFAASEGHDELARQRLTNSINLNPYIASTFTDRAAVEARLGFPVEEAADLRRSRELTAELLRLKD